VLIVAYMHAFVAAVVITTTISATAGRPIDKGSQAQLTLLVAL